MKSTSRASGDVTDSDIVYHPHEVVVLFVWAGWYIYGDHLRISGKYLRSGSPDDNRGWEDLRDRVPREAGQDPADPSGSTRDQLSFTDCFKICFHGAGIYNPRQIRMDGDERSWLR
jgi:hypothetical protein